jgi:DNA (cytosine-5)-methyltransferase 1
MRLVRRVKPDIVSMENVPELANGNKYPVFTDFVATLRELDYEVSFRVVDAAKYGVPQSRKRLVLLASRLGKIEFIKETRNRSRFETVRSAIGSLPRLEAGEIDSNDPLHRASRLNAINQKRIAATPRNGGSAASWDKALVPKCYRRKSGKSYMCTVYGRMRWNDPSPTMTTQCTTLGTGRFGHPTQNRAISLREAALLQSFP